MNCKIVFWNADPEFLSIFGITITYYGLFIVTAIIIAYFISKHFYIRNYITTDELQKIFFYIAFGGLLGARIVHCLFYESTYYLNNVLEIFIPFKTINGSYTFTGYRGLASHGLAIGIVTAIFVFSKVYRKSFLWLLDGCVVSFSIIATSIRLGNLMNSEIIGIPTNGNWGFVFMRVDTIPRHPAQLYEAFAYFFIFFILFYVFKNNLNKRSNGIIFSLFTILTFTFRFFIEFYKKNQVDLGEFFTLNIGQYLSIPFIIIGVVTFLYLYKYPVKSVVR